MKNEEILKGLEAALYRFDEDSKCGQAIIAAIKEFKKNERR